MIPSDPSLPVENLKCQAAARPDRRILAVRRLAEVRAPGSPPALFQQLAREGPGSPHVPRQDILRRHRRAPARSNTVYKGANEFYTVLTTHTYARRAKRYLPISGVADASQILDNKRAGHRRRRGRQADDRTCSQRHPCLFLCSDVVFDLSGIGHGRNLNLV